MPKWRSCDFVVDFYTITIASDRLKLARSFSGSLKWAASNDSYSDFRPNFRLQAAQFGGMVETEMGKRQKCKWKFYAEKSLKMESKTIKDQICLESERGFLLPPLQGLPSFSGRTNRFEMSEFRGIIGSFDVNSHEKVTIAVKNGSIDVITNEGEVQTAAAWEIGCWMKLWIKNWMYCLKNYRNCEFLVFFNGCPWCSSGFHQWSRWGAGAPQQISSISSKAGQVRWLQRLFEMQLDLNAGGFIWYTVDVAVKL